MEKVYKSLQKFLEVNDDHAKLVIPLFLLAVVLIILLAIVVAFP